MNHPSSLLVDRRGALRLRAVLPALSVLLLLLPAGVRALIPQARQIMVVDADADPRRSGVPRGAVFLLTPGTSALFYGASHEGLVNPVSTATAPDRKIYVVDADADPLLLGRNDGCLWIVDPADIPPGTARLVAASPLFRRPADILVEPEGTVLLLDSDADPNGWGGNNGAVFRVDPQSGQVEVVAAPASFAQPRCLAWDLDGSVLVLDQTANPQGSVYGAGAIFRLNRQTGAISVKAVLTRPRFVSPAAVAVIPTGAGAGDLLLVDKDADPEQRGTRPGAVFRIPKRGGQPTLVTSFEEFLEPVDIVTGMDNDFLVLDSRANPQGIEDARGAIYRFDLESGDMAQRWISVLFQDLAGLTLVTGASVDSSQVSWTDENQGLTAPGDFITVRANIVNTGTVDAPEVELTDTLSTLLNFVAGSDSAGSGVTTYDPAGRVVRWTGSVALQQEVEVKFRLRVSDLVNGGANLPQALRIRAGNSPKRYRTVIHVSSELRRGTVLFADFASAAGVDEGRIYAVEADSTVPTLFYQGSPLKRPSDLAVLDDGRIAILDRSSPRGPLGAILVYSTTADTSLATLLALRREDGFAQPFGIDVDHDGNLLVVDRDANPNGYPPPHDTPGAVFRFDVKTARVSLVASDPSWVQPLDAAIDRNGHIVVVDFEGGAQSQGAIYEIIPGVTQPHTWDLPSSFFRDPVGVTIDRDNSLLIADPNSPAGDNPRGGAVLRLIRQGTGTFSIVTADTLLRQPGETTVTESGALLIADREADPNGYGLGDRGAIFHLRSGTRQVEVAAASQALRQPDGLLWVGFPDLALSSLRMITPAGRDPATGDTVRFEIKVINVGRFNAGDVLADLALTENLLLETGSASRGQVNLDPDLGRVTWTGRVAVAETVQVSVRARVAANLAYGAEIGARVSIPGGRDPFLTRTVSRTVLAPFGASELLLADQATNGPGGFFRLPGKARGADLLFSQPAIRQVTALEWTPSGGLLLAAAQGNSPGRLFTFDTSTGTTPPFGAPDTSLKTPIDLMYSTAGDLFVVDRDARGPTGGKGVIFRKTPGSSLLRIFSSSDQFRSLGQMAIGPGGVIYVVDGDADPAGRGGDTGAIFAIDPGTGEVLHAFQDQRLVEPAGIVAYDDSSLIVTDPEFSANGGSINGALFRYSPAHDRLEQFALSLLFRYPVRSLPLPNGDVIIVDQQAAGPGQTGSPGTVFSYNTKVRLVQNYAWSDSFLALSDITLRPGPLVEISSYSTRDINGPPLHPSDQLEMRAVLRNKGTVLSPSVTWSDTLPPESSLLPATAQASSGTLAVPSPQVLNWSGSIGVLDSVVITYNVQLNPASSQGKNLTFRSEVHAPSVGRGTMETHARTNVPLESGYLYVLDQTANPYQETGVGGALFKTDMVTGVSVPMLTSSELPSPRSLALFGTANPRFLILDERYAEGARRGALFVFDPSIAKLSLLATDPTWVRPRKVLPISEHEALVLDPLADPLNLTPGSGPGAIYSVNLDTGDVAFFFSDTTISAPSSMALLRPGVLAISDEDADPIQFGTRNGAIYTLDLDTKRLHFFASGFQWRKPVAIAPNREGGLAVADEEAIPVAGAEGVGSIFNVTKTGQSYLMAASPFFSRLADVQVGADRDPIVVDSEARPFRYGQGVGSLFAWSPDVQGGFVPLGSSPLLRTPISLQIYQDPTPAGILEAKAEAAEGAVVLSWQGPPAEQGTRYLVYRRLASGPEDPGDPTPIDYDLVSTETEFLGPGPHRFLDTQVTPHGWYVYLIAEVDVTGRVQYADPLLVQAPASLLRLELRTAMPNPFQGTTTLQFSLPAEGTASLALYDVSGRTVRTLLHGVTHAGTQTLTWDGKDDNGHPAASGLYFSRLEFAGKSRTSRVVLMR